MLLLYNHKSKMRDRKMVVTIKYCDRCKRRGDIVKAQLVPRLQKEFPEATFEAECLSFCGPGSKKPFVAVNNELVYADSDDELVRKIDERLRRVKVKE